MKPRKTWEEKRTAKIIIGPTELGKMFRRSRFWAQDLLREWYAEQERGGDVRVIKRTDARGRVHLETTLAVVHRYFPPARDEKLWRKVEQIEKDLDFVARKVDRLVGDVELANRRLVKIESMLKIRRA